MSSFAHAQLVFECRDNGLGKVILDFHDNESLNNNPPCKGGFCAGDDKRFVRAVKNCRKHSSISHVELSSGGGNLDAGIKIAAKMREFGLHTHVPAGSQCVSSCTIAFLGGVRRTVDPDGSYVVHSFYSSSQSSSSVDYLMNHLPAFKAKIESLGPKGRDQINDELETILLPDFVEITRSTIQFTRRVMSFLQKNRLSLKLLDSIFEPILSTPKPRDTPLTFDCSPIDQLKDSEGPANFILNGVIHEGDNRTFKAALNDCLNAQKSVNTIALNSPGGDIDTAFEMADLINKHGLATSVTNHQRCEAACNLLFLAGFPRLGKSLNIGKQWIGEHEVDHGGKSRVVWRIAGKPIGVLDRKINIGNVGTCIRGRPVKNGQIMNYKECISFDKNSIEESIRFEGGILNGLSGHYYHSNDGYNSKVSLEKQPLSMQLSFKILGKINEIFPKVILNFKKSNPTRFEQLLTGLAQHESEKIISMQSGQALTTRRLFRLIRASRVHSKFMDHMIVPGIKGTRTLTPAELQEIAITTGP